ncbi:LolA family protein [Melioribacter sp. Ez-97]|uniref:LolA family protein n=1 Tax=Melioribacter sp. Ez-97 TaxID=3423434 RepID=UPI003ED9F2C4
MLRFAMILLLLIQSAQTDPLLKKLQDRFNSIDNFAADFKFTSPAMNISGKFIYKKQNKFVIESGARKIVSDSRSVWNYDITGKRVIVSDFKEEPSSFTIERYLFELPKKCDVKNFKDDEGKNYLELIPNNEMDFKKIIIEISDDFFRKIEITDFNGEKHILELNNIKTDVKLREEIFTFVPPKGIRVIDLR